MLMELLIFQIFLKNEKYMKWGVQEVSGGMWLQFAIGHLSQDRFWEKSTLGPFLILT